MRILAIAALLALAACSRKTDIDTTEVGTYGPAHGDPGFEPSPPAVDPTVPEGFVDVAESIPSVRLDMRYAQADNFLKKTVYPCARCLLKREAAEALAKAQIALEKDGYGLKLWDCYRPLAVQHEMWKIVPDARFVADPKKGSIHNRGGAVDVTLVTKDGKDLELPTAHDDFSAKAAPDAPTTEAAAKHREILRKALEAQGFTIMKTEWWHFDASGSRAWPVLDVPLCEG